MRLHRALIAAIAVLCALAFVACGGDESGPISLNDDETSKSREDKRAGGEGEEAAVKETKVDKIVNRGGKGLTKREVEKLSRKERRQLSNAARIRFAANTVLKQFGLRAKVTVGLGGREVLITFDPKLACAAGLKDEARIRKRLRQGEPMVKRVAIVVEGDGSLTSYVKVHCKVRKIPTGPGKVVFEKSGSGFQETEAFRVKSKRWAIEWENAGGFFSVFIFKGDQPQPAVVTAQERGVGRKVMELGPGRYKLKISGSGDWTVRVRDGE